MDAERDGAEQWLCLLAPGGRSWHQVAPGGAGAAGWVSFRDLLPLQLPLFHWPTCLPLLSASPFFLPPSPIHPSAYPSACLSILTSVHSSLPPRPPFPFSLLYIHLSTHPPIHLSIHPPILPSVHPFTHPCISFVSSFVHPPQPVHLSLSSYSSICHLPAHLSPVVKIFCPPTLLLYPVWLPVVAHHLPVCPSALPSTCLAVLLTDHLPCFIPHLSEQSLGAHPSVHLLVHPLCSVSALRKSHQGLPSCSRVMPQPIMWPQKPPAPSPSPAC